MTHTRPELPLLCGYAENFFAFLNAKIAYVRDLYRV